MSFMIRPLFRYRINKRMNVWINPAELLLILYLIIFKGGILTGLVSTMIIMGINLFINPLGVEDENNDFDIDLVKHFCLFSADGYE